MQAALTTPATRTRCARTSTRSPTFPRHKGGTGGCSWGLVVRGAAEAEDLEYHPKVALRCQERELGAAEDDERAAGQPLELLDCCGPVATRETMLGRRSDVLRRPLAQAPVHGLPIEELDPPLDVGAGHLARRRREVDGLPPAGRPRGSRRSRSRPAAGRRCCASASPPDRTSRRTPCTLPGCTRPARPRGGDALLVGGADGHEPVRVDDPPGDHPELFAFHRHVPERPASASCNERTTSAPSPTADATRFVEPLRTSPMAKTSGRVVSRSNGWPLLPSRCSAKLG
jgi:hypothetical protein